MAFLIHLSPVLLVMSMLILGLAKTGPEEEGQRVRFGFALACLNTLLVALAGWALLALQ